MSPCERIYKYMGQPEEPKRVCCKCSLTADRLINNIIWNETSELFSLENGPCVSVFRTSQGILFYFLSYILRKSSFLFYFKFPLKSSLVLASMYVITESRLLRTLLSCISCHCDKFPAT